MLKFGQVLQVVWIAERNSTNRRCPSIGMPSGRRDERYLLSYAKQLYKAVRKELLQQTTHGLVSLPSAFAYICKMDIDAHGWSGRMARLRQASPNSVWGRHGAGEVPIQYNSSACHCGLIRKCGVSHWDCCPIPFHAAPRSIVTLQAMATNKQHTRRAQSFLLFVVMKIETDIMLHFTKSRVLLAVLLVLIGSMYTSYISSCCYGALFYWRQCIAIGELSIGCFPDVTWLAEVPCG